MWLWESSAAFFLVAKISSFSDNYDIVLLHVVTNSVCECFNIWSMIYSMKNELHSLKSLENGVLNSVFILCPGSSKYIRCDLRL